MPEPASPHPPACEAWQPALAGWLMAQQAPDEEDALRAHLAGVKALRLAGDLQAVVVDILVFVLVSHCGLFRLCDCRVARRRTPLRHGKMGE